MFWHWLSYAWNKSHLFREFLFHFCSPPTPLACIVRSTRKCLLTHAQSSTSALVTSVALAAAVVHTITDITVRHTLQIATLIVYVTGCREKDVQMFTLWQSRLRYKCNICIYNLTLCRKCVPDDFIEYSLNISLNQYWLVEVMAWW